MPSFPASRLASRRPRMPFALPPEPVAPGEVRQKRLTESEVVAMEQATAVDTERRRYLEDKAAVSKAFDLSRDPSERAAKLSEFEKKYTGYQHKDPRVQAVVKGFLSTELPQTKSYFEGLNLDVRRKNLEVEAKRNEEGLYRAGDQQAFAISVFKQVELGMIDQPTKDAKIAAFPANSAVAQMKDAVLNNDLAGATRLAAETKKLPLTLGQKADVAELEGVIEQAKKEGDSQARVAVLMAANEAAALPEGQKYVERKRLKAEYAATGPTPADYREMSNWVDSRLKGEEPKVDPMAEIEADEAIRTISDESTQQEKKAVRDQILGLASRLGPKVAGYIKDLDDRLDVVNTGTVTLAVETAVARGLPDTDAPIVRRGIEKYVRSLKGNVDPADVMAYGAKLAVIAKSRQRELFTPEAKALAVGKLMAYDYPYAAKGQENGVPTFDEAVRFMQSTLGLDWVTLAPRAIEVLTERYPLDMWSRVPEAKRVEVIKDMVERARWQNKPTAALGTDALDKAQEIFGDPPQLTPAKREAWDKYVTEKYTPLASAATSTTSRLRSATFAYSHPSGLYISRAAKSYRMLRITGNVPVPYVAGNAAAPVAYPVVQTNAEYDALPSGTDYLSPDGQLRRKR